MRRAALAMLVLLAAVPVEARIGSVADAPSIRGQNLLRKGRHELTPTFGVSLYDPYTRNLMIQASYQYHFLDWLSAGAEFTYAAPLKTALTKGIEREVARDPGWVETHPGQEYSVSRTGLGLMALAQVSAVPLSGKLALLRRHMAYVDFHVTAGAGICMVKGIGRLSGSPELAILIGGGLRVFPTKVLSVNIDVKDYMVMRVLAQPNNTQSGSKKLTQNPAVLFGVSFFLPMVADRAP